MAGVDRYTRVRSLFGETSFNKIRDSKVLLLGVGGVGGFCLDALFRSGVGDITIVDEDFFEITNQNRQIGSEALGEIKVAHLHTLYPSTSPIHLKIDEPWIKSHDFTKYDLVIDAIDDMPAKLALVLHLRGNLISSMGGAKKIDPTQIRIDSIWNTKGDGLAKKFRYMLRKANFEGDFQVVYSPEVVKSKDLSSFVGVTGSFGLALASLALQTLASDASHPL